MSLLSITSLLSLLFASLIPFQTQTQPAPKNDYSKAETWFAVPAGRMPAQSI